MKTIQEMSLKEKIGQLIVAGFAGPSLSEADYAHFEQYHICLLYTSHIRR